MRQTRRIVVEKYSTSLESTVIFSIEVPVGSDVVTAILERPHFWRIFFSVNCSEEKTVNRWFSYIANNEPFDSSPSRRHIATQVDPSRQAWHLFEIIR